MITDKMIVLKGDITRLSVDAIVNAANSELIPGGGVCGAIHQTAGPELAAECKILGGCATGEAKITQAYQLPAKFVIHTVGPVWSGGNHHEADFLAACYQNSMQTAVDHHLESIAFPAISCGIYGYPVEKAAVIAVNTVAAFLLSHPQLKQVIFTCFDDSIYGAYKNALDNA